MRPLRTVVVGSGGRLGAALAREWANEGDEIVGFNHSQLDLGIAGAARAALNDLNFDVLVNCGALTNVDYCETHEDEANQVNDRAVRELGEVCARKGARCIHISTDYVFDGEKRAPYVESDEAAPISVYGASKRAGELSLLEASASHLAVRVSWVFGPDRASFVDQILKRAVEHEQLQAVGDKWAVPTYTLDVAQLLRPFLIELKTAGILHLCNAGECTWQEYGQFALDCALDCGAQLKGRTVNSQRMAELKAFIAKRPVYTVMSTEKLTQLSGNQPRSWKSAVEDYVRNLWVPASLAN